MSDVTFLRAYELPRMIGDRNISATEVLEAYLAAITKHNPNLNAIIATLNENQARLRAQEADEALSRRRGPLHGVAITVKDYFETAGLRTTCSYKPLANYIPKTDATAVARLKAAGAIIQAKMNMPKQAVGFQTDSPLLGRANNLWNLECTPGGSSGGGAAAVAAGLSPLDLGSDGGGSIRIRLAAPGPIARSVEDLQLCLSLIEGWG
ncbi:MAG: hypothetical protein BRC35_06250 [Cyanobacteria bacterium QH_10_48_56]|nr:MAG: hypothetical protein BRC35_06250 [Cyanobacteria bacterium QH_10_48_56]